MTRRRRWMTIFLPAASLILWVSSQERELREQDTERNTDHKQGISLGTKK